MVLQSVHEILANVDITMLEVDQLLLFGEGWRRSPIVVQLFGSSAALVTMLVLRDEALMLELFVIVNLTFNRRKRGLIKRWHHLIVITGSLLIRVVISRTKRIFVALAEDRLSQLHNL